MTRALFALGFCSLALAQSPASTDWRFAHPDADMKLGINLQALLKSDAIVKAIEQGKAQAKDNAAQIELALAMLRTVDRISVSAHQKAPNDMDVLVQVTGSFEPQLIAGFFPSTGKSQVKVVGPHTILIGEGDSFTQAVARMAGTGGPHAVADLEESDIWIEGGSKLLAQSGQPMPPGFQGLRGFSMGLTLSESPVINLALTAADNAGAAEMLKTVQLMSGPLLMASPETAALGKALTFKQDGSKVRMHLTVPPELMAMAQQQAASASTGGGLASQLAPLLGTFGIGGSATPSSAPAPSATPASAQTTRAPEPPPQNGGKIVIYGLDNGTKELPAQK